ncbi:nucleotidyltransferase domain-containing protein [Paracoccus spongiarum]|uniref:Nucleotidyltransferase domain-containing protein n=1 Tax=Paracoccus spongiarum TaxID=3064387 RepID=A0ABT9JH68_9RHOB|nr:nucleotidyltransferase domain-containing protein [Paracoccus sp. 2205BS29-5]MDP5309065.1 nucleotidyltransferase domain-containing protein [Paracoccus sp. 2205BS29-5]
MTIVSISGPDNVGKTTQIRWLCYRNSELSTLGGVQQHDPDWPIPEYNDSKDWWFTCSTDEHVAAITRAYRRRAVAANGAAFVVLDRGPRMFAAVCAATHVAKEGGTIEAALEEVERKGMFTGLYSEVPEILLLPSPDVSECVKNTLQREDQIIRSPLYPVYQEQLSRALLLQSARGLYSAVHTAREASIADVSNRLSDSITGLTGKPFSPLFNEMDDVVVLSGLSESGKSSVGELARLRWGYSRLKISYLAEVAADRMRLTLEAFYALPSVEIAEAMLLALDRFAARHYYLRRFTLESAHRYDVARHWKRVLGNRICLLFIDASEETRHKRTFETEEEFNQREIDKKSRGAHHIKNVADQILLNDGSRHSLEENVARILTGRIHDTAPYRTQSTAIPSPLVPEIASIFRRHAPKETLYAGMMGSLVHGGWSEDSDIDILIVVSSFCYATFEDLGVALAACSGGRKIALNIIEESELLRSRLNGNLTHKIRLANARLDYRLVSTDWVPPPLTRADDILASEPDLIMAVTMLRRHLVLGNISHRQIVKYTGIVAKILLRQRSIDVEPEQSAIGYALAYFLGKDELADDCLPNDSRSVAEIGLKLFRKALS